MPDLDDDEQSCRWVVTLAIASGVVAVGLLVHLALTPYL